MDVLYNMKREAYRRGLSPRTISTYAQCIRQFMAFRKKDLKQATKKDVREYIDTLIDRNACGNTLNVHINALRFVLQEILNKKVMIKVRYSKTPKSLPVVLSREEVMKLFSAIQNATHKLMLELIYSAGLRVSEAVALKAGDIEPERGIGWVRHGKGNKDRPFIIAKCISEKVWGLINGKDADAFLFPGRNGHLTVRSVQEIIKDVAGKAGIRKRVHPHTLRHSFATHLIEDGYDIVSVQPLLGHSSAKTTLIYVHTANPERIKVKSPYDTMQGK
ncbi:MAG: tyrosine-type recombinase/integrase [Nanoarchaeota archaeon]